MTREEAIGGLLVASFVLWIPAAVLPARIWTAPLSERLTLVAERRRAWQAVNLSIAAAAVLLVLGFAGMVEPLERAGAGLLATLSLVTLLLGASLWLTSLAFRVTAMTGAPEPSDAFRAVSAWAGGLFLVWTVLGNAAVIGFGAAVVDSGYPAAWAGWAAIVLGSLMLGQLVLTGDALPALYHLGPGAIGLALLLG